MSELYKGAIYVLFLFFLSLPSYVNRWGQCANNAFDAH